jgi:hypothetical protein
MIDRTTFAWPDGRRAAVSITYDDARPSHHEIAGPALEAFGLRATFYTPIIRVGQPVNGLICDPEPWKELAARGHELGNHSLVHPCHAQKEWTWLPEEYDLASYTPLRWMDEMRAANFTLSLLDGKTERTFGNTCCHNEIGQGETERSLEPLIEELFVAGRGDLNDQIVDVESVNYNSLGHFSGDTSYGDQSFENVRHQIDSTVESGGWIIYMIHAVGEKDYGLYIALEEHTKLVNYLGENQESIWTAPVVTVANHLKSCDTDYGADDNVV